MACHRYNNTTRTEVRDCELQCARIAALEAEAEYWGRMYATEQDRAERSLKAFHRSEAALAVAREEVYHLEDCNRKLYAGRNCPNCGVRVEMHVESDLVLIKESVLTALRSRADDAEVKVK